MFSHVEELFPLLLKTLSDPSDEVSCISVSQFVMLSFKRLNNIKCLDRKKIGKLKILLFFIFLCVLLCTISILNNNNK